MEFSNFGNATARQISFLDGPLESGDQERLRTLLERVRRLMGDGRWRTLSEISQSCGGTEASVSARIRDLRKSRNGSHLVERRNMGRGLYEYRVVR